MPNTICLSCMTNLELLTTFRKTCLQNNETSKLWLNNFSKIKTEEILLEDVTWNNEFIANSPLIVCNSSIKDNVDERGSSALEPSDSKQTIQLIENVNSMVKLLFITLKSYMRLKLYSILFIL